MLSFTSDYYIVSTGLIKFVCESIKPASGLFLVNSGLREGSLVIAVIDCDVYNDGVNVGGGISCISSIFVILGFGKSCLLGTSSPAAFNN